MQSIFNAIRSGASSVLDYCRDNPSWSTEMFDHRTPLSYAVSSGKYDIAMWMVSRIPDLNVQDNLTGYTPLHAAVVKNCFLLISELIKLGADVDAQSVNLKTPLHYAISNRYFDIARLLLENGADPNVEDKDGHGALDHLFCDKNLADEIIRLGGHLGTSTRHPVVSAA